MPHRIHPLLGERTAGVLLHPTSLPAARGTTGVGDLGPAARRFCDWVHRAGLKRWQMLPIGPVGAGDSPYSSLSSFAIEPMLASMADLVSDGWLPASVLRQSAGQKKSEHRDRSSWSRARSHKLPLLEQAFDSFCQKPARNRRSLARFQTFKKRQSHWLLPWTDFAARQSSWKTSKHSAQRDYHAFVQWILDRQWQALRKYAGSLDIKLIGDLPIFCGADSADVKANPELFRLDRSGRPQVLTGCPPDPFAVNGQLWGHPHYRWAAHRKDNFAWWTKRVKATLDRFDLVRIDHFIGFVRAYEVPGNAKDARKGKWGRTPGRELLTQLAKEIGHLPFIAEDLGEVTPAVHRLRDEFELPGMRILQWAFFDADGQSNDLSHQHPRHCVVYPGTHDNDTIEGWHQSLDRAAKKNLQSYFGDGSQLSPSKMLIQAALHSPANTAVIQMQDLLGHGRRSRMNVPGRPQGNWLWRLKPEDLNMKHATTLHAHVKMTGR
ncbi:MAG: 4-alpha-glucanotransferase [Planctomycetota bacterium]|nr:4-alpha-glucanotransferase [Planctomycetota bacterium]